MRWNAHAKLNLALGITGKRPDGYHLIDTIFQEISLADVLEIEPAGRITTYCPGVSPEDSTVQRAAEAFFQSAGFSGGASIRVEKNIPMGAGLGGGSSDAAAVLCALNHMYGHPLPRSELLNMAVRIGADTPAFINGGTQRARGIGDILSPIQNRCRFLYLLVKPQKSISTKDAYALYDRLPKTDVQVGRAVQALQCSDRTMFREFAANALLPAASSLVPEIPKIGQELIDLGAAFWMLTGSGSCVFGIFRDEQMRERAKTELEGSYPFVCCAEDCSHDGVRREFA